MDEEIKTIDISDLIGDTNETSILKPTTVEDIINPDHVE